MFVCGDQTDCVMCVYTALRFERKLTTALRSTEHLGVPNAFRTAICFDVLIQLSAKFARFKQLMGVIRNEAESAIYIPATAAPANATASESAVMVASFVRKTYFAELRQVMEEKDALEKDLYVVLCVIRLVFFLIVPQGLIYYRFMPCPVRVRLDGMHAFMAKQLRNNEQMVDRLAQRWARVVMKQTLVDWKKIIIRKKYTRVLLEKTSGRWSKQRLSRLFRRWATYAGAEKLRKTCAQLSHFQENKLDFQDLLVKLEQQIESAKQETKTNREHVDFAKRQLLGLEDLLHQLDLRVRQSNERKLQNIVNQWGKLCFALVECEFLYLQNMLDAVSMAQYVDVATLTMKGEELGELLNLPSDVLVLRWINFQLAQCPTVSYCVPASTTGAAGGGFIQNFTSDMRGYYVLRHILQRILTVDAKDLSMRRMSTFVSRRDGGAAPDASYIKVPAPFAKRDELRAALCEKLDPRCPAFLGDQVLDCEAMGDLTFCLFSFLVCEHPSLTAVGGSASSPRRPIASQATPAAAATPKNRSEPTCPWQDAQTAVTDARAIWESIRVQWTELQTPFEIQESTKTTPDVTTPPSVLLKANVALQNAVNMVQYACSKRSAVMKTWGCVQRKIQQDALRLLMRRGRKELPLVLMDRRVWREKYMLTTLHVSKLAAQFTAAAAQDQSRHHRNRHHDYEHKLPATRELLEAELQDVEPVLEEHYEALRRVYRYYAAMEHVQGPVGMSTPPNQQGAVSPPPEDEEARFFQKIAMSMSLLEFHAFLKDCRVFGTTRPFPYEFIQHVFEQVNVEVAAATDAAMLAAPGQSSSPGTSTALEDNNYSDNCTSEMTPAEFVEALLHIARSKYVCLKPLPSKPSWTLAQRMRKCIEEVILPHAMQEKERANVFRPQLLTAECREIFTKHQKKLAALYVRFASTEESESGGSAGNGQQDRHGSKSCRKMLSVAGLVRLCRHFDLLREHFLNLDDVQHVLAEILQLERESIAIHDHHASGTGGVAEGEASAADMLMASSDHNQQHRDDDELFLTYAEFVEALAAIACYLRPDAFVPLATKLDEFCLQQLHFGFTA